ncbi:uncharacterized protein LOC124626016 isoform X1 [Ictalurus punctatus]|uniref:Uncharacterized protein LOC124626016 isoform X1 n=1 Tax=Ictalurus punctatus TaxID=7998 RepID=A0A979EEY6_ICTPU|nr:uncharacterized protein LOC124626016 isoform X1 [Ictalurus punctatus]
MSDKHNMMHFFTTTTTTTIMSDKYMTRFFPTPTQPSITTEKSTAYSSSESTQQSVTTQKSTAGSLPTVLSVTGVCVLLAGLMGFCLCVCINKQKTESRCKLNTTHRDQGTFITFLPSWKSPKAINKKLF